MIKSSTTFLISIFLISCSLNESQKNTYTSTKDTINKNHLAKVDTSFLKKTGYYKLDGDSLIIPPFEIEVDLSPKANQKLKSANETIIVAAIFFGQPKDTTSKEYLENGQIFVASSQRQLADSRLAKFDDIKFSKSMYDSLADRDIQLLINIVSGRKSSTDNLLDCEILQDKMSKVQGKRFTIKGKLIYGDD